MTATLTATPRWSLVSPVLVPTDAAAAVLVLTHLVAATIVIRRWPPGSADPRP